MLGLVPGASERAAEAAPRAFTIVGGGWGHGIGMSQYGAHGMALRGASAGRIISFYYGGAQAWPASLPGQVRGLPVPGRGGSGRFSVSGASRAGGTARRTLGGHVTWVSQVTVLGVKNGRRTSATVSGAWFRKAYALKSTKFHISP